MYADAIGVLRSHVGMINSTALERSMITYTCEYDLKSETQPMTHLTDTITCEYALSAEELASRISVQWALVRGETNDVTNLLVTRAKETA